MSNGRQNWLLEVRGEHRRSQICARVLVKGLGRGLAGQIDAVGADFDALMEDFAQDCPAQNSGQH